MNRTRKAFYVLLCLSLLLISTGCGTVHVPMKVLHPAEINMTAYQQVAITDISGHLGKDLSAIVKNKLVEANRFKLVDRNRLNQILSELNLSQSDLADEKNRVKLGKLLSASALIAGYAKGDYTEKVDTYVATCYKNKVEYSCKKHTRNGKYMVTGSIDVIDVQTGQILKSKLIKSSEGKSKTATDQWPSSIDRGRLKDKALNKAASEFVKAVTPWVETVKAPFATDGKIPDLQVGINSAKLGEMDEAVRIFADAARAAEGNPEIKAKSIAKAYWNMGLVYEYTWKFDDAIESFKKAYKINPASSYLTEIENVKVLKVERSKLAEQGL